MTDDCSLTVCWWLWRMTPFCTMTHCPSMTWRLDVSLLTDDLTWHSTPTTCWWLMLMTCHATFTVYWWLDVRSLIMCWWLTYNTLLYNDSLHIHDLTSWRLTAHQWLDLTFKHSLRVDDLRWWLDIRHSLFIDDLMSAHSLCVDDFDVWHPAVQWLTAHPWLDVLTSHYSTLTWRDIETPTAC